MNRSSQKDAQKYLKKLKRHRLQKRGVDNRQGIVYENGAFGRIELLKPSADQPALRRYVPPSGIDYDTELKQAGVLDLRSESARKQCRVRGWGDHLVCGDSASVLSLLPEASVSCIVTSPPYWNTVDYGFHGQIGHTTYEEYLEQMLIVWKECDRLLMPNGKLCINTPILPISKKVVSEVHTRELRNLNNDIERTILDSTTLRRYSLYIWQKQTTEKMFGSYPYPPNLYEQNTVEFINVLVKPGNPRTLDRGVKEASKLTESQWMDLTKQIWWMYPEDIKRTKHPAPFPEAIPNRLIAMYTFRKVDNFEGDIVLDPFCGTGATCVAAKRLGRHYVGIDLSPDFCLYAAERVKRTGIDGEVCMLRKQAENSVEKSLFEGIPCV